MLLVYGVPTGSSSVCHVDKVRQRSCNTTVPQLHQDYVCSTALCRRAMSLPTPLVDRVSCIQVHMDARLRGHRKSVRVKRNSQLQESSNRMNDPKDIDQARISYIPGTCIGGYRDSSTLHCANAS